MNIQPLAWGIFLSAAMTVNAGERLTMAVSPVQSFAPTNLKVRVHVPSDDANRALEVSADSGEYYRSSRIQLDGKDAPRTITVEFQQPSTTPRLKPRTTGWPTRDRKASRDETDRGQPP